MAHVFSIEKVIMFDFFLLGHDSLLHHRITHISMLWFHKTKVMVHCFLVWIAHVESYIMLWSVLSVVALPQVIQRSFPRRRDKTMKVTYESLIMDALFVLTEIL